MNTHFESLYPSNSWNKEIEQLITFVKEGNSNQLIGLPGVGRANLLRLLSYNEPVRKLHLQSNEQWFLFVLANFSEVKENKTKRKNLSMSLSLRAKRSNL